MNGTSTPEVRVLGPGPRRERLSTLTEHPLSCYPLVLLMKVGLDSVKNVNALGTSLEPFAIVPKDAVFKGSP